MISAAVVSYGNIGRAAVEAIGASPDFELAGVVSRSAECGMRGNIRFVRSIDELSGVQAAVLCGPSVHIPEIAEEILKKGISTVDCFDIHGEVFGLFERLDAAAKKGGCACVTAVGFDPGLDSAVRALFEAAAPGGLTYTDFGPGMSMGHTVAVKAVSGVSDALSVTIPAGAGVHRRMVYVVIEDGADFDEIAKKIKNDPYFVKDETVVARVPAIEPLKDMGHGARITRKGVSGTTHNQRLCFEMSINNPALTAQMMISAARAVLKRPPGAYTILHLPVIDMLPDPQEELIRRLV